MTPLDKVLALLAIVSFIAFMGILVAFVPQVDLIVVVLIGVGLALYDFYRTAQGRVNKKM
ncbi:hypothetical protein SAMN06265365_10968 [Tistlia consotensis]|uniref:Uncharacterized protein n=1 Tax=Tistlia consotensis USBA 355 TaxID=560819 RepID=A0A1Y6CKC5_9PROT|nr:hypothetical protein [Tistlia consotensis]SMF58322.1 hypothetical protein SAMN05428998_12219 [Tistlia consotensis USBA 355]SNR63248.1 hypothetical protein SAMN06265365_10968 [Tistlia consotensis]